MPTLDYALFDADNHYYETRDCFTRHMEAKYAHLAVRSVFDAEGQERILVGDRPFRFMDPKFDVTNRPGSLLELLRKRDESGTWAQSYSAENMLPAYQHRDARLAMMDEQGIETVIMLPTLAVCVEQTMRDDVVATYANLRSFNRWLDEEWGFDYRGRILTPPLLSLLDLDEACKELDRVLRAGARVIHLRPGPAFGRSPGDPHFDPFWARLHEAKVAVAFHISDSGYSASIGREWGQEPEPNVRYQSAFQWAFLHGDRPIMETLGALIYDNLFGRFPNLQILSLENGSGWVAYLLDLLDHKKGMGRRGPWLGGYFRGRPSEVFKRHVYVSPYPEDDVPALVRLIGAERVLFGSDFPHPEGLAEPARFADLLEAFPPGDVRRIMRDNAVELFARSRS
ncbi:MAG: amidohydrolase family protein [Myxococcota bacterium]